MLYCVYDPIGQSGGDNSSGDCLLALVATETINFYIGQRDAFI